MIRLIWATPDADKAIAYIARVSNPDNQANPAIDSLLRYMMREGHVSPFEMANACIEINTTRDIGRQLLRHRSFAFQEFCVTGDTLVTLVDRSGVAKKRPIEKLYQYQSDNRMNAIWDRGIRVYDESSKTFIRSKIKEVFKTGLKTVYKVKLEDDKEITCTNEHRFFTESGFARLGDLSAGAYVAVNGQLVYQSAEWMADAKARNLKPDLGVSGIAKDAGVSYHTIRKWLKIHKLQFTKKENAIVAGGAWNKGLPTESQPMYKRLHSDETREKLSRSARRGEDCNFYVNGSAKNRSDRLLIASWQDKYRYALLQKFDNKCNYCNATEKLEIDHVVAVSKDRSKAYDLENLQILCDPCHRKKTIAETVAARKTVRWKKIVSIEPAGEQMTYDLEVEHESHNYIANGIVTHNSQRYADASKLGDWQTRECRLQDTKNRQNSLETDDKDLADWWAQAQNDVISASGEAYRAALAKGIAKEQARALLPEGLTPSRIYANGTFRSWIHYLQSRLDKATQKEHRLVAEGVLKELYQVAPVTIGAFFPEQVHNLQVATWGVYDAEDDLK